MGLFVKTLNGFSPLKKVSLKDFPKIYWKTPASESLDL